MSSCQTLDAVQGDIHDLQDGTLPPYLAHSGQSEQLLASPCPQVEIVDDLSSISDFKNPKKQTKTNLISRVDLKRAESTCKLASRSAIVDLQLIFDGKLGAKGKKKSSDKQFYSYPFFVAVTAPSGKIMAKEIFAASLTYGPNETSHSYFEKMRQIIPINKKSQANLYKVLVGFQVTPDQLAYNREHMVPVANADAAKKATKTKQDTDTKKQ
ncbi:MAG: hypothetical protein ACRBCK_08805 [Alphaproteobacteria bacterium]